MVVGILPINLRIGIVAPESIRDHVDLGESLFIAILDEQAATIRLRAVGIIIDNRNVAISFATSCGSHLDSDSAVADAGNPVVAN